MTLKDYSTLEKVELLINMIKRNPRLGEKWRESYEGKMEILNLVDLGVDELDGLKADIENISGGEVSEDFWAPGLAK